MTNEQELSNAFRVLSNAFRSPPPSSPEQREEAQARERDVAARVNRREHTKAIERVLDAIEALPDMESEIEVLCHALVLVGARNAALGALDAMEQDL